jgi:hypothetical protein
MLAKLIVVTLPSSWAKYKNRLQLHMATILDVVKASFKY